MGSACRVLRRLHPEQIIERAGSSDADRMTNRILLVRRSDRSGETSDLISMNMVPQRARSRLLPLPREPNSSCLPSARIAPTRRYPAAGATTRSSPSRLGRCRSDTSPAPEFRFVLPLPGWITWERRPRLPRVPSSSVHRCPRLAGTRTPARRGRVKTTPAPVAQSPSRPNLAAALVLPIGRPPSRPAVAAG